jgi:lysophospholipase L1-like esterase
VSNDSKMKTMKHSKPSTSAYPKTLASRLITSAGRHGSSSARRGKSATFVAVFAAVGVILLIATYAATTQYAVAASPQSGTLAGGASLVTNATAIGGRAVRFSAPSQTPAPTPAPTTTPAPSCGPSTKSTTPPSGSSYGTNALSQWNCALTNRASTAATWVAWGDSITEGQGSSTVASRWINQTLNGLRSTYPVSGVTGGFGYIPSFYGTYGPDSQWSTNPTTSGSATWNLDSNQMGNGAGLGLLTVTLNSGGSETFKVTGSSADILYNYGSGTFSYKVDSGASTNVSTSGGTGATGHTHVAFSSAGSHTLTISGVSGSVILEGVMTYNGDETKGIRLYDSSQSGTTTGEFVNQGSSLAAITAHVKADLVTIQFGGNDFESNDELTPSQVTANLKTLVSDIRSAATGHEPSIVLVVPYNHTGTNNFGDSWPQYVSAIKAVASADPSLGVIDLTSFATEGSSSPYLSSTDDAHPNNTGQTKLATMIESYLEDE